jgi:beta-galactosidase GanA
VLIARRGLVCIAAVITLFGFAIVLRSQISSSIPQLVHSGSRYQFLVDGKSFIMLGEQSFNDSSSTVETMARVWRSAVAMHANTVELPVYWNLLEPQPGQFDFQQVDSLIQGARSRGLRLVLLWYGTWKNGVMYYTPDWIKDNPTKYFHAVGARASISTFCTAARDADAQAYAALLKHIKSVDQTHTVIMIQVENETGVVSAERDHCAQANRAYESAVPEALMDYLEAHRGHLMPALESAWEGEHYRRSGTWPEVFGDLAPEASSAWHLARYVDYVVAAGRC